MSQLRYPVPWQAAQHETAPGAPISKSPRPEAQGDQGSREKQEHGTEEQELVNCLKSTL
jgi:hypothetical protein